MNKFFSLLLGASLLAACGNPAPENDDQTKKRMNDAVLVDGQYTLDKVKPKVTWQAEKLAGGGHYGSLPVKEGAFKVENGKIVKGFVAFGMEGIEVLDLVGDDKSNLENHLRSGDFFNTELHPTASLRVLGIADNVMTATLDLNGVQVDYSIPVDVSQTNVPGDQQGIAVTGKFDLDRTKHDITYRSQTFDDKLDWFIKDNVSVGFAVMGVPVQ